MAAGAIAPGTPALIFATAPSKPCSSSPKTAAPEFCLEAAAHGRQVQLKWTPPAQRPLAIYDGTDQDFGKAHQVGTVTGRTALVTDLTSGTTYYFWLVDGEESNVVSNMRGPPPR